MLAPQMSTAMDPAETALRSLLRALGLEASREAVDELFLSHPDYPSLAAFSDALDALGISHDALQASKDSIEGLSRPHLAYLESEEFVVVERLEGGLVHIAGRGALPLERYLEVWSGVVLVPSGAHDSKPEPRRLDRAWGAPTVALTVVAVVVLLSAGLAFWANPPSVFLPGVLGASLIGLIASGLLTAESLGLRTAAQRLCQLGAKTSCASVLASRAARLGPVSMTDVGLGYFAGGLLVVLFAAVHSPARDMTQLVLTALAVASLPYTIFSVAYQGVVVKRWCPLCLLVQGLLWAEAGLGVLTLRWPPNLDGDLSAWAVLLLYPVPFALWWGVKPSIERSLKLREQRIEYERLVRDPAIIQTLIELESPTELPPVPIQFEHGAKDAPLTVTIYTDPTCGFCRERHLDLEAAVALVQGRLRVIVRILGPMHSDEASWALVRMLAQDVADDRSGDAYEKLSRWFQGKRGVPSVEVLTPAAEALLARHRELQERPLFGATPVIFVNDRRWPSRIPLRAVGYLARARLEES